MELLWWIIVFIVSLVLLVKGADWLVDSSEKIGLIVGFSPFVVGVTIVALGTSLPELATSIAAVVKNTTEVVSANVVGSNIANILLVLGISALAAGKLIISRSLIDIDLPLVLMSSFLFLGTAWDKVINRKEGILLLIAFLVYLVYTILQRKGKEEAKEVSILSARVMKEREKIEKQTQKTKPEFSWKIILFLGLGIIGLTLGAKYTIESTIKISDILKIAPSIIAITAIAVGTSLPELIVSARSARKGKHEIAVGNVLGSNIFNVLLVIGIPALIKNLAIDHQTLSLGMPVFIIATLFFVISGISQRFHKWEGAMYLVIYIFFIGKLFNLF